MKCSFKNGVTGKNRQREKNKFQKKKIKINEKVAWIIQSFPGLQTVTYMWVLHKKSDGCRCRYTCIMWALHSPWSTREDIFWNICHGSNDILNYSAHFIKDVSLIFNFCAENYARIKTCTSRQLFPKEDSKNLRITEVNNLNIFKNRLKYDLASVLHEH